MNAAQVIANCLLAAQVVSIPDPIGYAESHVSFEHVVGNSTRGFVKFDEHQKQPYLALFDSKVKKVTNIAPPQVGKSLPGQVALVVKAAHGAFRAWVAYENDDKAEEVNKTQLTPLMKSIPSLKEAFKKPGAYTAGKYTLDTAVVLFSGMQNEFATHSVEWFFLSEVDRSRQTMAKRYEIFNTVGPRVSRFERQNRSKIYIETSPSTEENVSWQEFLQGTQEYWHIRCLECNHLWPSHLLNSKRKGNKWIGGLRWEKDDHDEIDPDSLRLHCYDCDHAHKENELREMNRRGEFIAKFPNRIWHRSFQTGWAAGWRSRSFFEVAKDLRNLARVNTYEEELKVDNNLRGLPHQQRQAVISDRGKKIMSHCTDLWEPERISMMYAAADAQIDHFVWTISVIDECENMQVLAYGFSDTLDDLYKDCWEYDYHGIQPEFMFIDEGGGQKGGGEHVSKEIHRWINRLLEEESAPIFTFKGNSSRKHFNCDETKADELLFPGGRMFSKSDTLDWRVLASPGPFHDNLLHQIYSKKRTGESDLYLPPEDMICEKFVSQIMAEQPPANAPNAHFSKWSDGTHGKRVNDIFDCLKITKVMIDFSKKYLPHGNFRKEMSWFDLVESPQL